MMRAIRDVIKWSLVGVLLVLPESGFTRIHQSPLMESQGVCLECEQLTLFDGLQQQTEELLHPVQHGPRVYRTPVAPKRHVKVKPKMRIKARVQTRIPPRIKSSPRPNRIGPVHSPSGSAFMRAIAHAATMGAGNAGPNLCYSSVKRILARAGLRGWLPGGSAYQGGRDLIHAGFHSDMSACTTPGTVRVYNGPGSGRWSEAATAAYAIRKYGKYTKGDLHGHIEVVGEDGKYYYNPGGSPLPMNEIVGSRRILTGCYVK